MQIREIGTDAEVVECYPVMKELRPHLEENSMLPQYKRQQAHGYRITTVRDEGGAVAALAGFRITEFMAWGKVLYIDDLITDPVKKRKGYAGALLDWLETEARSQGCHELHLDTGYARHDAHRLYLKKGWLLHAHHLSKSLAP